jgi:hypothetical protein
MATLVWEVVSGLVGEVLLGMLVLYDLLSQEPKVGRHWDGRRVKKL